MLSSIEVCSFALSLSLWGTYNPVLDVLRCFVVVLMSCTECFAKLTVTHTYLRNSMKWQQSSYFNTSFLRVLFFRPSSGCLCSWEDCSVHNMLRVSHNLGFISYYLLGYCWFSCTMSISWIHPSPPQRAYTSDALTNPNKITAINTKLWQQISKPVKITMWASSSIPCCYLPGPAFCSNLLHYCSVMTLKFILCMSHYTSMLNFDFNMICHVIFDF